MFSSGRIMFSSVVAAEVSVEFDVQPAYVKYGGFATFSVTARSVPEGVPLTYQWYRLPKSSGVGSSMLGQTSSTLNLSGLTKSANEGDSYRCRVRAMDSIFSSSAAELWFEPTPFTIQEPPRGVFACGLNSQYALGDGTSTSRPWMVRTFTGTVERVTSGARHGFALSNGLLWGWGARGYMVGLGDWQAGAVPSPVQVGSSSWREVAAGGGDHTLAIRGDGSLWGWGLSDVDDGRAPVGNSPQLIAAGQWSKVSAGGDTNEGHSAAIRTEGSLGVLYTFGRNVEGQLGIGNNDNKTFGQAVIPGSWKEVSCGRRHTLGIKSDGTLWAWGENEYGQVGDGTLEKRNSPVLLDGGSWSAVSAGAFNSLAIRSDGSLWGWGSRSGNGTKGIVKVPNRIGSGSWSKISAGAYQSAAIASDGTLWTWGDNFSGALSNDYATGAMYTVLSPVQVDSGNWRGLDSGRGTSSQFLAMR
jgi:alpha-tubulin suppressor-like RCC1 family protein